MDAHAQDLRAKASKLLRGVRGLSGLAMDRAKNGANWAREVTSPPPSGTHDLQQRKNVERLCALGFSSAAACHALLVCGGRVEDAGAWLLDRRNADDQLAAEAIPLRAGCAARVSGLRGSVSMNGLHVTLMNFNAESQRWTVKLSDGSAKAIRPRNLRAIPNRVAGGSQSLAPSEIPAQGSSTPQGPILLGAGSRQDLQARISEMLGDFSVETTQALQALSVEELLETLASTRSAMVKVAPDREGRDSEHQTQRETQAQLGDDKRSQEAATQEAVAPDREGHDSQDQTQRETQAQLGDDKRSQEAATQEAVAPDREGRDSEDQTQREIQAQLRDDKRSQEAATQEAEQFRAEREELDRFKAQTEQTALELKERELRMLEREAEQMRLSAALREEQSRLDQQRRHVLLLQRSLTENVQPEELCVQMKFDESGCVQEPPVDIEEPRELASQADAESPCQSDTDEDEVWDLDWNALTLEGAVANTGAVMPTDTRASAPEGEAAVPSDVATTGTVTELDTRGKNPAPHAEPEVPVDIEAAALCPLGNTLESESAPFDGR